MIHVAVQTGPIDLVAEIDALDREGIGAVASFCGHVRADDGVTALELEHYPGMTEAALMRLAQDAVARWALLGVRVVHRVGTMSPGDRIVLVVTAAAHRASALEACAFVIDRLKTDAPFWKRETRGSERRWVQHRADDTTAARRWDQEGD